MKNGKVYMKHNSLGDDVPIVVILRAMGATSDQEIVQLVSARGDDQYHTLYLLVRSAAEGSLFSKLSPTHVHEQSAFFAVVFCFYVSSRVV